MTIELAYPQNIGQYSTNKYYEGKHHAVRSRDKDFWHWLVAAELIKAGIPKQPYEGPVELSFSFDDRLDCSNHSIIAKIIEDALKGWVIQDDSRRYVKRIIYEFNDQKKMVVEVRPYEPGLEVPL